MVKHAVRWAGLIALVARVGWSADPIPPGRLAVVEQYTKSMKQAGYESRGSAGHYPTSSIAEYELPGKPQAGGYEIISNWTLFVYDKEEEAKSDFERRIGSDRSSTSTTGKDTITLPGGMTAERFTSRGTNDSEYLVGDPWVNGGATAWWRSGAMAIKVWVIATGTSPKGGGEAKARAAETFARGWLGDEVLRVMGKDQGDALRKAVKLVLRAIKKSPPVVASAPGGRVMFASDSGVRFVAEDNFCPPWYGNWPPVQADEALAPAVKLILEASTQQPRRLADEFLANLNDPETNKQVYFLLLAGEKGSAILLNNLAARLPADDKLLRYIRGRRRFCQRQQADQWRLVVADGQFCAGIFFATVDALMSVSGFPVIQASGTVLSYAQIIAKMQEQDPKLQAEVPADMQKMVIGTVIQGHPEWHVSVTAPLTFADVIVGRWKAKWETVPGPQLAEVLQDELLAVPTEGAWLDLLDKRQVELGREFVLNQAVSEALTKTMEANGWGHEDRSGLELPNSDRWIHEQARREADSRAQAARVQVPVVGWFAGRDTAIARAGAGTAAPATNAGDALFGAP